jgi:hypothetical protein
MSERVQPKIIRLFSPVWWIGLYSEVTFFVFMLNLIPMWLKVNDKTGNFTEAQHDLKLLEIHNNLVSAIIDVSRTKYEPSHLNSVPAIFPRGGRR